MYYPLFFCLKYPKKSKKVLTLYTTCSIIKVWKGGGNKVVDKIKKVGKVIEALTDLALKVGTLLAVIKMLIDSLK